ncbi:hypothetical protein RB653_005306 [Dictyostelium firmibasis]|uniref:ABC transporter domain-containing protein n=1 Tax=Dictyostelium firmibasis TaxID=79012 RepID=A0AAN7UB91_9MYCE
MGSEKKYKSNQFRAMFFKNATFIKRQKCSMCVQISIPLVLVIILVIVNLWVKSQIGSLQPNSGKIVNSTNVYNYDLLSYGYMFSVNENNNTEVGYKDSDGNGSGLLNSTIQRYVPAFKVYTPFFIPMPSVDYMDSEILALKENATFTSLDSTTLPVSAIIINDFNIVNRSLDYTIQCEQQSRYSFQPYEGFIAFSMNTMATAMVNYFLGGVNTTIKSEISTMPYYQGSTTIDIASLLGGSFYPFALSFIMPLYIYSIVYEKQEKLRDLSLMMGLKIRNYWFMTYIFNFLIYAIIIVFVVGVSSIFKFAVFAKGSQLAMFLFLFAWGNSMITFSFFLSTFFKKTRAASIFGYFLVIIAVNLNSILSFQVFKDSTPPVPYYWVPLLAFYRGMTQLSTQCGIDLCPEWSAYSWDFEMSRIIFWLYIDAVVYLLLALYLDQVLPREFGVPSHPLFFLKPIGNLFKKKEESQYIGDNYSETSSLINSVDVDVENNNNDGGEQTNATMDDDVLEEKEMIANRRYNPNDMTVIIEGLSKHYPGRPKPAVDGLYLSVRKGEVLGFLGANGAGKTTTISMLTGLYTPTSGTAHVAGLDIRYDMDSIHHVIGVAMQFDIFWEDLSCVETLLYYTRLKGIPPERELESVENILKEVNLFEVKERLVKELSGGMKRRLSFAVAMTGDSSIIFLDEPSTGLSPEIRRDLWRTINELKKNRSIILTTHSMEEADVLSSRIAIISQGKLQCIGTQNHLKAKFGDGYSVRINVEEPYINTHNPTELITKFSPQAVLTESFDGSYNYRFPKDTVISDLYQYLVSHKYDHHLQEWSFSQTSLEDVFLKISANDDTIN